MIPRRAVSSVIASLLLVAITVVGGIILLAMVSDPTISNTGVTIKSPEILNVKIMGFDTRDGLKLSGITGLDNTFDKTLTSGSEHIVLTIRNPNLQSVLIFNIMINQTSHTWDKNTAGAALSSGPVAGKFSIIPTSGDDLTIVQQSTAAINAGSDVRLVIKLNSDNILLYETTDPAALVANKKLFQRPIPIDIGIGAFDTELLSTGIFDTKTFVIPGGSMG